MIIYIDSEFCCHKNDDGTMRMIETDIFDGKGSVFIEGYRYIPENEIWIRSDGVKFEGIMVAPIIDYSRLEKAQEQYELDQVAASDMLNALEILGVTDE